MPHISWNEVRERAIRFSRNWSEAKSERADKQTFYNEFFEVFGIRRASVAAFEANVRNLQGHTNSIDLLYRGKLIVEHKSRGQKLSKAEVQAFGYIEDLTREGRFDEVPRFILVSDFASFVLYDLEPEDQRDLPLFAGRPFSQIEFTLNEFPRRIRAFAFLLGQTRVRLDPEDPANERAYQRMCELHDALEAGGYDGHDLEVFLVRILFCVFAEDTGIFEPESFTQYIRTQTRADGSDLGAQLNQLFNWLDKEQADHVTEDTDPLFGFRYVNGGLFQKPLDFARCTKKMREALLECCEFHWAKISPAVFGSLFQGVMDDKTRRQQGAHYTSERDIMKVLRSLFLDELQADWKRIKQDKSSRRRSNTEAFHQKLRSLKFLDPACGCGNFLVLAYRELRALEIEVVRELGTGVGGQQLFLPTVNVDQFFGIEYSEWPVRIAEVALWLMDHQMNQIASEVFGQPIDRLPLKSSPHIFQGNALRVDWNDILPKKQCSYVLGNPPFVGAKFQTSDQRSDMAIVAGNFANSGLLDYVCGWYFKAAAYIQGTQIVVGFVSTNSITQGEQVAPLWRPLLDRFHVTIHFAHRTFAWASEARGRAHVHVVIIGIATFPGGSKQIYDYQDETHPTFTVATNINPYLADGPNITIANRSTPISEVPELAIGNKPIDNGQYLFTPDEKNAFLKKQPEAAPLFRRWLGAEEYINGIERWCLWVSPCPLGELRKMPEVMKRVEAVRDYRLASKSVPTQKLAADPTHFHVENFPTANYLVIPEVSSERRNYIPIGFLGTDILCSNKLRILPEATHYHFGILSSGMHMAWVRTVTGRLKSDFQYSVKLVYNNFPWPNPTPDQIVKVKERARAVLDARAPHLPPLGASTMADLYDPLTMPSTLASAHAELDRAVEKCYRPEPFKNDSERVKFLFVRYESIPNPLLPKQEQRGRRVKKKLTESETEADSDQDGESDDNKKAPRLPKWYLDAFQPQPSLENRGEIVTDSLDIIYDQIDEMICAKKYKACDRFLGAVIREPEHRDLSVLIGILTITLAAAKKLPNRARLREQVKQRLLATDQNAEAALMGL